MKEKDKKKILKEEILSQGNINSIEMDFLSKSFSISSTDNSLQDLVSCSNYLIKKYFKKKNNRFGRYIG